jgi:hypothetical protein
MKLEHLIILLYGGHMCRIWQNLIKIYHMSSTWVGTYWNHAYSLWMHYLQKCGSLKMMIHLFWTYHPFLNDDYLRPFPNVVNLSLLFSFNAFTILGMWRKVIYLIGKLILFYFSNIICTWIWVAGNLILLFRGFDGWNSYGQEVAKTKEKLEKTLWKWTPMLPNVPRMEDFHC